MESSQVEVSIVMSKESSPEPKGEITNPRCELVSGSDVSYLEGRLKTFIDAIIPDAQVIQNKATKDIIRVILWDWFNFISGHYTDHLKDKKEWYKEHKGLDGKKLPENN